VETNQITGSIVDAAIEVHTALGPGLLESVYERCLKHELIKRGLRVEEQVWLPVRYDGVEIDGGYKIDLLIENRIIVELKVVEQLLPIHKAQLLSYLKLTNKEIGLLINFNVVHLRDGIRRLVNHYQSSESSASPAVWFDYCTFCRRAINFWGRLSSESDHRRRDVARVLVSSFRPNSTNFVTLSRILA